MSGRTLREFIKRTKPSGPHNVCYHCDHICVGSLCENCDEWIHIYPCNGHCVQCDDDAQRRQLRVVKKKPVVRKKKRKETVH
jgi:hypothetical protein